MRDNPKPFEVYRHFKGNNYQILAIAKDSEDGHLIVVYQALYGSYEVYARDLTQFMSPVDHVKYPDVTAQYRFTRIEPTSDIGGNVGFTTYDSESSDRVGTEKNNGVIDKASGEKDCEANAETGSGKDCEATDRTIRAISGTTIEPLNGSSIEEVTDTISTKNSEPEVSSYQMDPMVEAFLDADTYEEKINILAGLKNRITDEMLQIMAVTMDIELNSENTQDRYRELMNCLSLKEKFEVDRRF